MSLLSKLFGGKSGDGSAAKTKAKPLEHKGFLILPEPVKESGGYRIAARIEKEIDGTLHSHMMIRADTYGAEDTAIEASISKAKQVIDQMGERVFR